MLRVAARLPVLPGVKAIMIVQVELAGKLGRQLSVSVKSFGFGPQSEMPLIARAVLPVFVRTTDCGVAAVLTSWFPKSRAVVDRRTVVSTVSRTVTVRVTLPLFAMRVIG